MDTTQTTTVMDFLRQNGFIVGALSGSMAAYLLGLLVSHLRREKKWLGFSVTSRMIVEKGHPDLALTYKGRGIERLHSHAISVRNIGNRALTKQPIRIETSDGGEIVAHEVERPVGAEFTAITPDAKTLIVDCDLLNPGEAFVVGVTVVDSQDGKVSATARGEGLVCKQLSESIGTEELLGVLAGTSGVTKFAFELSRVLIKMTRLH